MERLPIILQGLAMMAIPFIAASLFRHRWHVGWNLFMAGAVGFIASQIVHLPLLSFVINPLLGNLTVPLRILILALAAGLCEEPARWLIYRYWLRDRQRWSEGVMTGLGHGGIEAFLFGVAVLAMLAQALALPIDAPVAQRSLADSVLEPYPLLRLLAIVERLFAMTFHVSASLLVQHAVMKRRPSFLLLAVLWHACFDGLYVGAALTGSLTVSVLAGLALASVSALLIRVFHRAEPDAPACAELPPTELAIVVRGLTRTFGGRTVVDAIDLEVARGEVFALLGPNGAGKTTTVRMLCGLIASSGGAGRVAGQTLTVDNPDLHARIGILTETPGLYERLSPRLNLDLFGRLNGLDAATRATRIEKYLTAFGLWERRDDDVSGFSKGMKQKVAIIRALLHEPDVIFLDEPTSGLDPVASREVMDMVAQLKREGRTILLTTHRLEEAEELADRVGILRTTLLAYDTVEGLQRRLYGRRVKVRLINAAPELIELARGVQGVREVAQTDGGMDVAMDDPDSVTPLLVRTLVSAGAAIRSVEDERHSLEDVYLDLIGGPR